MDVFSGYGMSETCPILTIAHVRSALPDADAEAAERIRTGYPIPLVDLRTVDGDMLDVATTARPPARSWCAPRG
jgi:fatty-acyl-CoA synthase